MKNYLIIFIGILLLISCFDNKNLHDLSNEKRNELNIPLLDSSWIFFRKGASIIEWSNPKAKQALSKKQPIHYSKTITFGGDGDVTAESDLYYGSGVFKTIDGTTREQISVTYYFKPQEIGDSLITGWFCTYTGNFIEHFAENINEFEIVKVQIVSKSKANEILSNWGFK